MYSNYDFKQVYQLKYWPQVTSFANVHKTDPCITKYRLMLLCKRLFPVKSTFFVKEGFNVTL